MRYFIVLVGLAALMAAGCGTLINHTQYHVRPPAGTPPKGVSVPAADREGVKQIVTAVAEEFHFEDRTKYSVIPNVIAFYSQRDELYPITLAAWVYENQIVVDVLHQPYTVGETPKFQQVRERVFKELEKRFGRRAVLPKREEQIRNVPAGK